MAALEFSTAIEFGLIRPGLAPPLVLTIQPLKDRQEIERGEEGVLLTLGLARSAIEIGQLGLDGMKSHLRTVPPV